MVLNYASIKDEKRYSAEGLADGQHYPTVQRSGTRSSADSRNKWLLEFLLLTAPRQENFFELLQERLT